MAVETGVPQVSPVSPILFAIKLKRVFREVEKEVKECVAKSFVDACGWLVETDSVEQLCE